VLFTMSLMIGTAGLPHVIIRFFTVPKVSDARWSAGWALIFIALLYLTAPAVGSMARLNLVDTIQRGPVGSRGDANLAYEERPDWMQHLGDQTGLLTVRGQERRRPHPVLQRPQRRLLRSRPRSSAGGATS
jgi:cation/acetate symporter